MVSAPIVITDNASAPLERLVAHAVHPGQLMSAIAGYMLTSTQQRFEREEGPDGKKWKALSPRTANRLIKRGRKRGTANILRVTSQLYQSISARSDETSAEVGTNSVYAAVHQLGGAITQYARSQRTTLKKIRGGRTRFVKAGTKGGEIRNITIGEHVITIPARPYLGFSETDMKTLLEIGEDYLLEEMGQ
ncbi:phage virion morphogenesis protein